MTRAEYLKLQPGDIIRGKFGKRMPRLVVSEPGRTKTGKFGPIGLKKIGRSWTDPNMSAWYDAIVIILNYVVTGSRGCSKDYAEKIRRWRPTPEDRQRFQQRFAKKRTQ